MKQHRCHLVLILFLTGCHFCTDEFKMIGILIPTLSTILAFSSCHIHNFIHKYFKKKKCNHEKN
jgi:hypothetical protein